MDTWKAFTLFTRWYRQKASFSDRCQCHITSRLADGKVISTDPPYYDNIGYADLSDFFYVWMRSSDKCRVYPDLFATLAVPKAGELVATPYRHGEQTEIAETFFPRWNDGSDAPCCRANASRPSGLDLLRVQAVREPKVTPGISQHRLGDVSWML